MKVLITVANYYPLKDGVQNVTQYLAEGLVRSGHSVTVVTAQGNGTNATETYNGVDIVRVNIHTKGTLYFGKKKDYVDMIIDMCNKVDVMVNVATQTAMTDLMVPHIDEIKCKRVLYLHGIYDFSYHQEMDSAVLSAAYTAWKNVRWGIYYSTRGKYFKKYDRIIQLHELDYGNQFFKKKYHIESGIIENAADDAFFANGPESKNNTGRYAISVANYCKRKNQEFILKAFYLSKAGKDISLVLIGSKRNKYYKRLLGIKKRLDKEYGERKVQILCDVDKEKTIKYVREALVYLLGSTWEAYPVSIIESMAAGVPFISTDVGCVSHLPGGYVVNDYNEMASRIDLIVNDDKTRKSIGISGYKYALEHSRIQDKVNQFERMLME